jgi:hypothetical protein
MDMLGVLDTLWQGKLMGVVYHQSSLGWSGGRLGKEALYRKDAAGQGCLSMSCRILRVLCCGVAVALENKMTVFSGFIYIPGVR